MIVCNNCGIPIAPGETACAECGNANVTPARTQSSANGTVANKRFTASRSSSFNPFNIVAAIGGAILFLALGAVAARFILSSEPRDQGQRSAASPSSPDTTSRLPEPGASPSQTTSPPIKAPSPPRPNSQAVNEVVNTLNGWAAATRAHDLDGHMNYYAETLDTYFLKRNVNAVYVRSNRSPAFTRYHTLDVQLSNIQVSFDLSGMRAMAIFDKTYRFEGNKVLSGSVQQLMSLSKASGQWRITGEKDLRVYYTNK